MSTSAGFFELNFHMLAILPLPFVFQGSTSQVAAEDMVHKQTTLAADLFLLIERFLSGRALKVDWQMP